MEHFLSEYGLSTREGVALMCLAEAMLRVPDRDTIDALIEDKIAPSDWGRHLGEASSSLGNASTWALMLTGKVLDDDQAIAIALALQTAPATVTGIDDAVARALTTLRQVMPARMRAASEAFEVTALRNYWEFSAPPIDVATLQAVGSTIRTNSCLRFDYADPDGRVPAPGDADFRPPHDVEPHHLVVWAGRWYLVARNRGTWGTYRVDRIRPKTPAGGPFTPAPLDAEDLNRLVVRNPERGDTPGQWQCVGAATLALPADVVARWAPGGSVVAPIDRHSCRLTIGGWSWAGVAGLFITFDTDLTNVEPSELCDAFATIRRCLEIAPPTG